MNQEFHRGWSPLRDLNQTPHHQKLEHLGGRIRRPCACAERRFQRGSTLLWRERIFQMLLWNSRQPRLTKHVVCGRKTLDGTSPKPSSCAICLSSHGPSPGRRDCVIVRAHICAVSWVSARTIAFGHLIAFGQRPEDHGLLVPKKWSLPMSFMLLS